MNTPIADFVQNYINSNYSRFHMPGHKGIEIGGYEEFDITEINGADVLSHAKGIIAESEENASTIFGTAHTFYTTQGSSTAIFAMLSLVAKPKDTILAARNVHKAFISGCALLDLDVEWLMPKEFTGITECKISAQSVDEKLRYAKKVPAAVYITSPDYLGNIADIKGIASVCKKHSVPLLVDNAHGAYLKFLKDDIHPITLGASLCCDSAHKTLPVLTGGAYLHVSKDAPPSYSGDARSKLALFSSTSPSYLILRSLDLVNPYLFENFKNELSLTIEKINELKICIEKAGFFVKHGEPLKIVLNTDGEKLADILRKNMIEPEFYDKDFLVLMVSPQNTEEDFARIKSVFSTLSDKSFKTRRIPLCLPAESKQKMTIRKAVLAPSELISVDKAKGRICACPTVSCPPAVPVVISGEEITDKIIELLKYYEIEKINCVQKGAEK